MNRNFSDMLSALSEAGADFLVVGAHALSVHGFTRATGDLDLWVRCDEENAARVLHALTDFGAPLLDLTLNDLKTPDIVFQIGVPPQRIDILTSIAGVSFEEAWQDRQQVQSGSLSFPVISRHHLLQNKRAAGRPKDLIDAAWMEAGESPDDETD